MLQARMSADDRRLYNPSRDVAHNFGEVMELVAGRLEDHKWAELDEVLKREGITMDDLGAACGAYCEYLAYGKTEPQLGMLEGMTKSGFFDCEPAAQVAVLAMIGTCYAGIQYAGVRESTIGGEGPLESVDELLCHAERFRRFQGMSWFRRRFEMLKIRIRKALQSLRAD